MFDYQTTYLLHRCTCTITTVPSCLRTGMHKHIISAMSEDYTLVRTHGPFGLKCKPSMFTFGQAYEYYRGY